MKTKLVIFGITGDLAKRKLLPALRTIIKNGALDNIQIIGVSRRPINIAKIVGPTLAKISSSCQIDLADPADYKVLKRQIKPRSDEQVVFYLSVPPLAATRIADNLGAVGLNGKNVKILFEKPFGIDLLSATEMVKRTARYFDEDQVYRIDHYLAKEMTQNIIAFRSGNALLRQVWNRQSIESIDVLALETIGVLGRVHFYEQVGALRDVVQGHLMQLLSLVIMDTPSNLDWNQLPKLRHQALQRILPADPGLAVRAQYRDYCREVDNPKSQVESFVAVELHSDSSVWEGVPLRLITGKALSHKTTEIRLNFRAHHQAQSNCLRLKIQPDEGIEIDLYSKKPGYDRQFEKQKLAFGYPEDSNLPQAYEQVIVDAVLSRKSLFTSSDEIIESWRILQPLLDSWSSDDSPIKRYAHGSSYHDIIGTAK